LGQSDFIPNSEFSIFNNDESCNVITDSIYQVIGPEISEYDFYIVDLNNCNKLYSFNLWCGTNPQGLVSLSISETSNGNLITWKTDFENETDYYVIESNTESVNFEIIGIVEGNSTSNQVNCYSFLDENFNVSSNIYRLSDVDFDDKDRIVGVVLIAREDFKENSPAIYPQPAKDNLTIDVFYEKENEFQIKIFDIAGKLVRSINTETKIGINRLEISLIDLTAGIYVLRLDDGEVVISERFVVQ